MNEEYNKLIKMDPEQQQSSSRKEDSEEKQQSCCCVCFRYFIKLENSTTMNNNSSNKVDAHHASSLNNSRTSKNNNNRIVRLVYDPAQVNSGEVSLEAIHSFCQELKKHKPSSVGRLETEIFSEAEAFRADMKAADHEEGQHTVVVTWHVMPFFSGRFIPDSSKRFIEFVPYPTDRPADYDSLACDRETKKVLKSNVNNAPGAWQRVLDRIAAENNDGAKKPNCVAEMR